MQLADFQKMIEAPEYSFLRQNEHLGNHIILLGLSGSYGYGTNREDSDVDFRGVALQRPSDILGLTEFEQYVDTQTDTVVYGVKPHTTKVACFQRFSLRTAFLP